MDTALCELSEITASLMMYRDFYLRVLESVEKDILAIKIGEDINKLTKVIDDIGKLMASTTYVVSDKFAKKYVKKMRNKKTRVSKIDFRKSGKLSDCIDELKKYYIEDMLIYKIALERI